MFELPQVYLLRKYSSHHIPETGVRFFICSLSTHTIVYKVGTVGFFSVCVCVLVGSLKQQPENLIVNKQKTIGGLVVVLHCKGSSAFQ